MRAATLAVLAVAACSAPRVTTERWLVDGEEVGTVTVAREDDGGVVRTYSREDGRVERVERRTADGGLAPGVAVTRIGHDDEGRRTSCAHEDAEGRPVIGPDGFAWSTTSYESDDEGRLVGLRRYFGTDGRPMTVPAGFSIERVTFDGPSPDDRVARTSFLDAEGRPTAIEVEGVPGTSEVTYTWLQGVSPIQYGVFRGPDGEILAKKKLAGATHRSVTTQSYGYAYYGYEGYWGYAGVGFHATTTSTTEH